MFRHHRELQTVASLWKDCQQAVESRIPQDCLRTLLAFARLECALADHSLPEWDDDAPLQNLLLETSLAAADQYLHRTAANWPEICARIASLLPPEDTTVWLSPWEGIRFYSLFPDRYARAAMEWMHCHHGQPAWVIGLRSIGSLLGAVVAAQLLHAGVRIRWTTLRPRGEPHQRQYRLGSLLQDQIQNWPGHFLLVDEGPGLSGSSLGGALACLRELGIPARRVALFPSWNPPRSAFPSPRIAMLWESVPRFPAAPLEPPASGLIDLSGGAWRRYVPAHATLPVWPQHERVKFLDPATGQFVKFLGLGHAAHRALDRARILASAGFIPPVLQAENGWIHAPWIESQPLCPRPQDLRMWAEHAGSYLAFLRHAFPLGPARPPREELQEMLRSNLESLHLAAPPLPPDACPVALDARMLPHEWGRTAQGWVKFDAIDHCDDPFFPGPCDIAWDLAAIAAEWGEGPAEAARQAFERRSDDRQINRRLPWYRAAYLAFRVAFCRLAATQTNPPDASRFTALASRYETRLRRHCRAIARPVRLWKEVQLR